MHCDTKTKVLYATHSLFPHLHTHTPMYTITITSKTKGKFQEGRRLLCLTVS